MPTPKQARAFANAVENGGNITKAMRDAGYSERTINSPGENLTDKPVWEEMIEKYLPDEKLLQVTDEGLSATRSISALMGTPANGKTVDFVDVPDYAVRHKYLETAYKLKNKLVERKVLSGDKDNPLIPSYIDFEK